jgi:outer membrane cobalamin receptor
LSCADPGDPCRLPNAFLADPPLEQVVAHTWEAGARGQAKGVNWAASAFRTSTGDDIIFISSGALTNQGHFANVGDTLRRGLEASAFGVAGRMVRWSAAYSYLRATFETPLTIGSPNHPEGVDGEIDVVPGASIPSVPRHNLKLDLTLRRGRGALDASLVHTSSQFLRGDESNTLDPIDGFTIVNLGGRFALHSRVNVIARLTNLFNHDFSTFGLLGEADDVLGDGFDNPRFVSPGAPRGAWIGLGISLL